jgi:hypothetical protein
MHARSFEEIERSILAQHEEIRACVRALVRNAERADLPSARDVVRRLFLRFAAQFDAHLAFEERELGPRVRHLDTWGAAREAALEAEHLEQRWRVEQVGALAEAPGADESGLFCAAVLEFADGLLADMRREETTLDAIGLIDEIEHRGEMAGRGTTQLRPRPR